MSNDLSDWGDPELNDEQKKRGELEWPALWKALVSLSGLVLIFYEAMVAEEVNIVIVTASLLMMGFPIARWLDKLQ